MGKGDLAYARQVSVYAPPCLCAVLTGTSDWRALCGTGHLVLCTVRKLPVLCALARGPRGDCVAGDGNAQSLVACPRAAERGSLGAYRNRAARRARRAHLPCHDGRRAGTMGAA